MILCNLWSSIEAEGGRGRTSRSAGDSDAAASADERRREEDEKQEEEDEGRRRKEEEDISERRRGKRGKTNLVKEPEILTRNE